MKKMMLFLLAVLSVVTISCNKNNQKDDKKQGKDVTFVLHLSSLDGSKPDQSLITGVKLVLANRLESFGETTVKETKEGELEMIVSGVDESKLPIMREVLTKDGDFGFWETYNYSEIAQNMLELDQMLDSTGTNAHPLFSVLHQHDTYGCIVGAAKAHDTVKINKILQSDMARRLLPMDLVFAWDAKTTDCNSTCREMYYLYALRAGANGAALQGDVVQEAVAEKDDRNMPIVSIVMNSEAARQWAYLTKMNVGKGVALVLDNRVYTAPIVNMEITGGRSLISGNFTEEETEALARVLKGGKKLPLKVEIVEEK